MSADGSTRAWLRWLLSHRLPLVGDWLLGRAADSLVRAGTAGAGRTLVEALAGAPVARQALLREALARLRTPAARAGACEAWAGCPDPALVELLGSWEEPPGLSPRARVLLALHLGRLERLDPTDETLADELIAACLHGGSVPAGRARAWIVEHRPAAVLERAARHWLVSRDPLLADVIEHAGYVPPPGHPARLVVLLYLGQIAPARGVGPEEVPSLLAAAGDADPVIASRARQALAELERPEARDALCRQAVEGDDRAEQVAALAGYRPGGVHEQALFLFVTRQWSAYEALDFDGSLLRVAYEAAPEAVRRRLARRAQQEGRRELVRLLAGERPARRLAVGEWRTLIDLLAGFREWPRLWELTRTAPPARTVEIVEHLARAGWTADDDLGRLAKLVAGPVRLRFGPGEDCPARWDRVVPGPVGCLAWHPSKPWLACVADPGSAVQVLDLDAGRRRQLPGPEDVLCLVVSAAGRTLAGGSRGGNVYLWTLPEGLTPRTLYGCAGPVTHVALTPDGKTLIGLAEDFAQVWDLAEDDPECKPLAFGGRLLCLTVSPDGAVLAVGGDDGSVWLAWHLPDGELKDALDGHQAAVVELAFRRDGRVLASRDACGQVRLWALAPPGCLARFPAGALLAGVPDFEADPAAVQSRRGARHALWRDAEGKSCLARIEEGALLAGGAPEGSGLCCLSSSPAHWLAAGDEEGSVAVWPPPGHWARQALVPLDEWPLAEWERVRQALARGGLSGEEARSLAFLDGLLARRWRHEVHATQDAPGPGPYDISVEEVRP